MNRESILALGVLSVALLACGSSNPGANSADSNNITVILNTDLGEKAAQFPGAFGRQARRAGCKVNDKENSAAANCGGEIIVAVRTGTKVVVACKKTMTVEECKALFRRIADAN